MQAMFIRNMEVFTFWISVKYYLQRRFTLDHRFTSDLMRCSLWRMFVKRGFTVVDRPQQRCTWPHMICDSKISAAVCECIQLSFVCFMDHIYLKQLGTSLCILTMQLLRSHLVHTSTEVATIMALVSDYVTIYMLLHWSSALDLHFTETNTKI